MNQHAFNIIHNLAETIDHMNLGWENIITNYINQITQKIELLEQERMGIINLGPEIYSEFTDLYEFDNHILLFKEIKKILERMKNRCIIDRRRQMPL